jgi:hypothetical protein
MITGRRFSQDEIVGRLAMATQQSKAQKETIGRVMHEFKHGELKTSRGKKVRNPKQAVAIGLHEAGASKYESQQKNRENLKRTKARERREATEKDRAEARTGAVISVRNSTNRLSAAKSLAGPR